MPSNIVPKPAFDSPSFTPSITLIRPLVTAALAFAMEVAHVSPAFFAAPDILSTPFVPFSKAPDTVLIKSCADIVPFDRFDCTTEDDCPVAFAYIPTASIPLSVNRSSWSISTFPFVIIFPNASVTSRRESFVPSP